MRTALAIVAWFVVLTIGIRIDSGTLTNSPLDLLLFLLSNTVTNVGILAVCASLIGKSEWPVAIRRGFVIYAGLISGTLVVFTQSVAEPTPEQFAKIAGTISVVSVLVSLRPELWDGFLDRIARIFESGQQPTS